MFTRSNSERNILKFLTIIAFFFFLGYKDLKKFWLCELATVLVATLRFMTFAYPYIVFFCVYHIEPVIFPIYMISVFI